MTYQKGQILVKGIDERKVLGVLGDIVFVSYENDFDGVSAYPFLHTGLEKAGWTIKPEPKKPWVPEKGHQVYALTGRGKVISATYGTDAIKQREDFFGVYRTEEECQATIDYIKECLKNRKV